MQQPDEVGRDKLRRYRQVAFLGKGAFAEVYEHEDTLTGRRVAIKRVLKDAYKSGVNLGAVKELQALQEVRHPNVLTLLDAFPYGDRMHLVLEFAVTDLTAVIRDASLTLSAAHAKGFALQLFAGLTYLHRAHVLHRDLKPDNVLLTADGTLKVADFGHAVRFPGTAERLHHRVVTVWYRAPELLCGARRYGPAVDVWAAACILAELLLRRPLFPGDGSDDDQLSHIMRLLGTPRDEEAAAEGVGSAPPMRERDDEREQHSLARLVAAEVAAAAAAAATEGEASSSSSSSSSSAAAPRAALAPGPAAADPRWPGCSSLPGFRGDFEPREAQPWAAIFAGAGAAASPEALDLLSRMLVYDPARRISAHEALAHPWFKRMPLPARPQALPLPQAVRLAIATRQVAAPAMPAAAAAAAV